MKKALLFTSLGCVLILSCKKNRICDCVSSGVAKNANISPNVKEYELEIKTFNDTKKKATESCDKYGELPDSLANHPDYEFVSLCDLK